MGVATIEGWRGMVLATLGFGVDPSNIIGCFLYGLLYFLPAYIVTMAVGGIFFEAIFSMVRGHEINEGFVVTGLLFPLTLPATIPLWQVGIGIAFGVVIGRVFWWDREKLLEYRASLSGTFSTLLILHKSLEMLFGLQRMVILVRRPPANLLLEGWPR